MPIFKTYTFWNYIVDENQFVLQKIKEILTHKSYNFDTKKNEYEIYWQEEYGPEVEGIQIKTLRYPAGLTNYLRSKINLELIEPENPYYQYTDEEIKAVFEDAQKHNQDFEIRDYQMEMVRVPTTRFASLILSGVGSGKTSGMSLLIKLLKNNKVLVMNGNNFILQQIYDRLISFGETDISWNPSKDPDYNKRIVLINTKLSDSKLNKQDSDYIQFLSEVNTWIIDEAHRMQALTGFEPLFYMDSTKLQHIVGYSGSPYRNHKNIYTTAEDFRLTALLGEPAFSYEMKDTVKQGTIAKPYAYFISYPNKKAYIPQNLEDNYFIQYRSNIIYNKNRNKAGIAMLKFLHNNDIKTIASFNNIKPGQNIMKELKEAGVPALFICGDETIYEWVYNKKGKLKLEKRVGTPDDIKKALLKDSYNIVIASQVLDEGVDIDIFQCAVLFSANKSNIGVLQRIGRASRKRKTGENVSLVVDFKDVGGHYIFQNHYNERKKLMQDSGIEIFERVQDFINLVKEIGNGRGL